MDHNQCVQPDDLVIRLMSKNYVVTNVEKTMITYADQVLENMERQFMEMLHVLRNGRQKIQGGQSLDMETTGPSQRLNPSTGSVRTNGPIVSRREATTSRQLPPDRSSVFDPGRNPRPRL